jgi:aryl-alcohol dehydrogenase-like predicted oxidoreductase
MYKLGATELTVSRLGLGLAALGRPGYINLGHAADLAQDYQVAAMREHCCAVLDATLMRRVRMAELRNFWAIGCAPGRSNQQR